MAQINWKSQVEIENEEIEKLLLPSNEELDKAKREMETINLLIELEVI